MKRKILFTILTLFILVQFIRPAKNTSADNTHDISTKYTMSPEVTTLMKDACYNCHSNHSEYPWYSKIQPVAWWLQNHINEGKKHLNYSEFTSRRIAWQNHKFEETIEMVEKKEMPLVSYTWLGLHPEAKLTEAERQLLTDWSKQQMEMLALQYPKDSLEMKRK